MAFGLRSNPCKSASPLDDDEMRREQVADELPAHEDVADRIDRPVGGMVPDEVSVVLIEGQMVVVPVSRALAMQSGFTVVDHDADVLRAAGVVVLDDEPRTAPPDPFDAGKGHAREEGDDGDDDRPWWTPVSPGPPARLASRRKKRLNWAN